MDIFKSQRANMRNRYFSVLVLAILVMLFVAACANEPAVPEYVISFDTSGGSGISPIGVKEGEKAVKPADPVREWYSFIEWQLNGERYDFSSAVTSDITLAAVWKEDFVTVSTEAELISAISGNKERICLASDISLENTLVITNRVKVAINLNGHSISAKSTPFQIYNANVEFKGEGIIKETESNGKSSIYIIGASEDVPDYSVVTIGQDVTLKGWAGIFIYPSLSHAYGIVVNMYGRIIVPSEDDHAAGAGIYIHGDIKDTEGCVPVITLDGASIKAREIGIYAAGYAKWNIRNSDIEADYALSLRAGEFIIDGGRYISTGKFAETPEDTSSGSVDTGAALSMTSNDVYAKKLDVTVNGGKFESVNGYAVYEGIPNGKGTTEPVAEERYVKLAINGGEFIGNESKAAIKLNSIKEKKVIKAGTFNSSPDGYINDDVSITDDKSNKRWVVK